MKADRIGFLGDAALLLRLGDGIDAVINQRVHACAATLHAQAPRWLTGLTPAYACLALHIDVTRIESDDPLEDNPLSWARTWLAQWLERTSLEAIDGSKRTVEIPVVYGGEHGPDLATLAAHAGIAMEDVSARHASSVYTVAMLGFAPGFPYLLGLDTALAMPRLTTPRTRVAAGSVGIGGAQTGIYPQAGPGGWRLIGRTPLRLFDAQRDPPCLLQAGDCVRFVAIDAATFAAMDEHPQ